MRILSIKISLFCILFGLITVQAQTTAIPDANFEQFLVNQGIDTNGMNGNILNTDAEAVTTLNVSVSNITDFTGLEAFVNLVTLNLQTNQFTTLPLATLTNLEELRFNNNNALVSLDVSSNTKLKTLDVRGPGTGSSQPITDLDLSNNTLLEYIRIYDFRNLSNVTFPNTDTVTYVYFLQYNPINVDFSGYANLETVFLSTNFNNAVTINAILPNEQNNLKTVHFQGGNIINVNLTNYLALESIRLQQTNTEVLQYPSTNTLTDINVTGHNIDNISFANAPMLESLTISSKTSTNTTPLSLDISQNIQLTDLVATGNHMTTIDVSQNINLEKVNISNNDLTDLDMYNKPNLVSLNASNNALTVVDVTECPALEDLLLNNNELSSLDVTQNVSLEHLNISNNLFVNNGLDLSQNSNLEQFLASNNQIETLDITHNTILSQLVIDNNLFSGNDILNQFYQNYITSGRKLGSGDKLIVHHNQLTGSIPDFTPLVDSSSYTRQFSLEFNDNNFHFGDFENQHSQYNYYLVNQSSYAPWTSSSFNYFKSYTYAPQAKVNDIENLTPNAGDNLTLTTTVRGAQNHYQWFKDGVAIADSDSPNLVLTAVTDCDSGVYYSEITSDLVPFENTNPPGTNGKNLKLIRNDITVNVNVTKSCSTMTNPANNTVDVPINTGLEWQAQAGACGYKLSVGTNAAANNVLNAVDVGKTNVYNFASNLSANTTYYVQVTPYYADGDISTICGITRFTTATNETIPECTQLTFPSNGSSSVSVTSNLYWDVASGADGYRISVGTSSGGTDILNAYDITDGNTNSYDLPTDLPQNTTIYVTVIAYNNIGDATGCSEVSFTTEAAPITIPSCTAITSPSNGATGISVSPTLTWNSVADATSYTLQIGTTLGGTDILNQAVGNVTTYNVSGLSYATIYYVTVIPTNSVGDATGCTEISFTTEAAPIAIPSCTTITSPSDGATGISVSPTLTWNSVADATSYTLQIGTTLGGTDILNQAVGNVTTYNVSGLSYATIYYVTVIPTNSVGDATGCTEISFTTEAAPIAIPSCTTITSPSDGATGISVSPTLTWNSVADATSYTLQIGTTLGGTDILNQAVGNVTTYNVSGLSYATIYYVTVIPTNSVGDATGCSEINFTTEAAPIAIPSCTAITSPSDGATGVATNTTISWDAVNGATNYIVIIGTSSGGNDVAISVQSGLSYSNPSGYGENTTYYVRVIPVNSAGEAANCTEISFTTTGQQTVTIPSCTTITSPTNGATSISVTPTLTWNSVTDATSYTLQIGTTSGGTDILNQAVGNVTTYDVSGLSYAATYYVTVIPTNSAGSATGCTEIGFTTEAVPIAIPNCTTITSPSNGTTGISVTPTLTWNSVTDATSYTLQIGTTSGGTDILNQAVGNVTTYDVSGLSYATIYYVTVIPTNSAGSATGCSEISFTTEVAPVQTIPSCTNIAVPASISNVSVSTIISWDSVSDASGYYLTIGTTSRGSEVLDNESVLGTTYIPTVDFEENTVYYVTVLPFNAIGTARGCSEFLFKTERSADETKYGISPNGDGISDFWEIKGIEYSPNNTVYIYNRWGNLVFKIEGYDNQTNVFRGEANQLRSIGAGKLPDGTYFFNIEVEGNHQLKKLNGYLEIRR